MVNIDKRSKKTGPFKHAVYKLFATFQFTLRFLKKLLMQKIHLWYTKVVCGLRAQILCVWLQEEESCPQPLPQAQAARQRQWRATTEREADD